MSQSRAAPAKSYLGHSRRAGFVSRRLGALAVALVAVALPEPGLPQPAGPDPGSGSSGWLSALVAGGLIAVALVALALVWRAMTRPRVPCQSCSNRTRNPGRRCNRCERRAAAEQRSRDRAKAEVERARQGEERARQAKERKRQKAERKARVKTLKGLQTLHRSELEHLIAEMLTRAGYGVVKQGGRGDGGIDLVLRIGNDKDVARCARSKSDIDLPVVRDFHESMMRAGARQGFMIATAGFEDPAREFARGKPVALIDGPELVAWVAGRARPEGVGGGPRPADEPGFDPYAVLGVPRSADEAEIRDAYRGLMAKYHPDKVAHLGPELQELALKKSQDITRAYQVLSSR